LKAALPPGISQKHIERGRTGDEGAAPTSPLTNRPVLTPDQAAALATIRDAKGFHPVLLHGVTGSGKTEVYMRAAEHFLSLGKPSLILVPEIGLTPQLTDRFSERFPGKTAVLHSSLTKRQRIDEWLRIYNGAAP